jgi:hypothetical protein
LLMWAVVAGLALIYGSMGVSSFGGQVCNRMMHSCVAEKSLRWWVSSAVVVLASQTCRVYRE